MVDHQQEALEFARSFFDIVTARVAEAGGPPIGSYEMPEINFVQRRTKEQEIEYEKDLQEYGDLWEKATEEPTDDNFEAVLQNILQEPSYHEFLPNSTIGTHDKHKKRIEIDISQCTDEVNHSIIAHELLHAIRDQTKIDEGINFLGYEPLQEDLEYFTEEGIPFLEGKIVEFFSQLEIVVLDDLGKRLGLERKKPKMPTTSDFNQIQEGVGDHIGTMILNYASDYIAGIRASYEKEESTKAIELANWMCEQISFFNNNKTYLNFVHGYTYKKLDELIEGQVKLLNSLGFHLGYHNDERISKRDKEIIRNADEDPNKLEKKYIATVDKLRKKKNTQEQDAYLLGQLTIAEHHDELKKDWPKVMLMSAEEVQAKYFDPVEKELERLRQDYEERFPQDD